MAKLRFQIEPLGYVGPIAMDHLAGNDRKEGPRKGTIVDCEFLAEFAVAESQTFARDGGGILGQDRFRIFETKRAAQPDHRLHEGTVVFRARQILHERAIELDHVDAEPPQIAK